MKEVFKKLLGVELMTAQKWESVALGAVVAIAGWLLVACSVFCA